MKKIVFLMLFVASMFAKELTFGVVLVEGRGATFSVDTINNIEMLGKEQSAYYNADIVIKVIQDKEQSIKSKYQSQGAAALVSIAKEQKVDSIVLVEYKKGLKRLQFYGVVADEKMQDRKSTTAAYSKHMQQYLDKMIVSNVLKLNYQLGVFNAKDLY